MDPADCDAPPEEAPSNDACVPRRRSCAGSDTGLAAHDGTNGDANLVHSPEASKSRPLGGEAVRPCPGDSGHTVTCTVTIALAIPPGTGQSGKKPPNKVVSGGAGGTHKPQAYYHVEYNLLPDGEEPTRVDLVLFGSAAKVYAGNETKVLKPWQEGNDLWLAWSQSVKLSVTRQLLVKMPTHKITFRVWDLKDRVSAKARYDRLKAFRAPPGESPEEPDQAGLIEAPYMNTQLKKTFKNDYISCGFPTKSIVNLREPLILPGPPPLQPNHSSDFPAVSILTSLISPLSDPSRWPTSMVNRHPCASGDTCLTECFVTCSGRVSAGLCSVSLDQPLLSEGLSAELNPLVITVLSASSLPSTPVPYHVLQQKCLPVYCQYSFPSMPVHRTKGQQHSSNVYFRDVNVIFTGLLSAGELLQTLGGTVLEIEVHDRDRKADKPPASPAVFGTEPDDEKLARAVLVPTKRTTHNAFRENKKLREPYGIAKLHLSDLLRGHRCLNLILPVRGSHPGSWLGGEGNKWEAKLPEPAVALARRWVDSMPMGHYIDANTKLKVQVEIARPLDPDLVRHGGQRPFGRIVYVFRRNNVPVLRKLRLEILRVNAEAFRLDSAAAQSVLCGHRMNSKERANQNLNILTGFHVVDQSLHLCVLEGLKEQAVRNLWETVPIKTFGCDCLFQVNVEEVQKASSALRRPKPNVMVVETAGSRPVHNYSIQTMNCTARALKLLREQMAKEPARRFSHSQHYHSFTVAPVDVEAERKASESRSRAAWRTYDGFVCPGFKSSMESNRHPKQPDKARSEEENVLHGNTLRPTLNRATWPWNQRHEDFELYAKPPPAFSPEPPVTVHLAGRTLPF
uniref:DUF4550 domain-containing protein n=1 Tax=Electrophorus electricus TaxID=8005 RepID=A0A4W4E062_ELEEL